MEAPSWSTTLFIMNMTGFWSIWAAAWSKTAFAITLLRLASPKIKWIIWFIIVTINVGLTLAAIFMWVQCDPPRKVWETDLPGTCWDGNVIVAYNSFISGRVTYTLCFLLSGVLTSARSVLWRCGHCACHFTLVDDFAANYELQRAGWTHGVYESGCIVSHPTYPTWVVSIPPALCMFPSFLSC